MALNQLVAQSLSKRFTRRAALQGGVALGAGAAALSLVGLPTFTPSADAAAGPLDSDVEILNYALTLEYLEAAAYRAINTAGVLTGRANTYFRAFGQQEQDHVDALLATIPKLGGKPVGIPTFNFSSVPTAPADIIAFFQVVEAVGVSAYLGAAGSIKNFDVLEAALSIHAVEAEHAAALADLVAPGSDLFAPEAFQTARTPAEVIAIVTPFLTPPTGQPTPGQPMPGLPSTGGGWGSGGGDLINLTFGRGR